MSSAAEYPVANSRKAPRRLILPRTPYRGLKFRMIFKSDLVFLAHVESWLQSPADLVSSAPPYPEPSWADRFSIRSMFARSSGVVKDRSSAAIA